MSNNISKYKINKYKKNSILISIAYFVSVTLSTVFMYGLLFHNRAISNQSTAEWAILYSAFLLPGAIVNIFVGIFADMYSKKRMMIKSELLGGFITLIFMYLFLKGYNSLMFLSLYGAAFSMLFAFFEVPLDASMVNLSGKHADILVSVIWSFRALAHTIGPILGRLLVNRLDYLFYLNAASFIISALIQTFTSVDENVKEGAKLTLSSGLKKIGSETREFTNYMSKNKIIAFLLAINLIMVLFYLPLFGALMPAFAKSLKLSENSLAYIESANRIGVIVASIGIASLNVSRQLLKNLFKWLNVESILLLFWIFPLFLPNLSTSTIAIIFIMLSALDGAVNTTQVLGALTYFQTKIPENMRGKVLGTMRTVMKLTAPFGIVVYGIALEYLSWHVMMVVTSLAMLVSSLILGRHKIFQEFKKTL